jgi:hypothetical protein
LKWALKKTNSFTQAFAAIIFQTQFFRIVQFAGNVTPLHPTGWLKQGFPVFEL